MLKLCIRKLLVIRVLTVFNLLNQLVSEFNKLLCYFVFIKVVLVINNLLLLVLWLSFLAHIITKINISK